MCPASNSFLVRTSSTKFFLSRHSFSNSSTSTLRATEDLGAGTTGLSASLVPGPAWADSTPARAATKIQDFHEHCIFISLPTPIGQQGRNVLREIAGQQRQGLALGTGQI